MKPKSTMKIFYLSLIILLLNYPVNAQKDINTTNSTAIIDKSLSYPHNASSTNETLTSKVHNFTTTQSKRNEHGRIVMGNNTVTKGFYFWDKRNLQWINIAGNNSKINPKTVANNTNTSYNQSVKSFTIYNKGLVINNANINKQIRYHIDVNKDLYVNKFSDYRVSNNTCMGLAKSYNEKNNWYLKPNDFYFIVLGIKTIQKQIEKQQTELNEIKGVLDNYDELSSRLLALENKKVK